MRAGGGSQEAFERSGRMSYGWLHWVRDFRVNPNRKLIHIFRRFKWICAAQQLSNYPRILKPIFTLLANKDNTKVWIYYNIIKEHILPLTHTGSLTHSLTPWMTDVKVLTDVGHSSTLHFFGSSSSLTFISISVKNRFFTRIRAGSNHFLVYMVFIFGSSIHAARWILVLTGVY